MSAPRPGAARIGAIVEYWASGPGSQEWSVGNPLVVTGDAEPCCLRCGWIIPIHPQGGDEQFGDAYRANGMLIPKTVWDSWTNRFLDGAHLKDHSYGGPDDPSNVVPLCHLCHKAMPDFEDRDEALTWVKRGKVRGLAFGWTWQIFTDNRTGSTPAERADYWKSIDCRSAIKHMYVVYLEAVADGLWAALQEGRTA